GADPVTRVAAPPPGQGRGMVEERLVPRPEGIGVSSVARGVLLGLMAAGRTTVCTVPQQGQVSAGGLVLPGVVHGKGVPSSLTRAEGQRAVHTPLDLLWT